MDSTAFVLGFSALGAGIAILAGAGVAVGQGFAVGQTVTAMARQPESRGSVMSAMLLGCAIMETAAIYGLVIAMILLFANPLVSLL
jgi:F-type H+-transporting ATPase subunit c